MIYISGAKNNKPVSTENIVAFLRLPSTNANTNLNDAIEKNTDMNSSNPK